MRQFRWIDWAIVFLTALILLIAASGAAIASWDQPQISLTPGTWQIVEFTNIENEPENLEVVNISTPLELLSYVVISPSSVPANSSENVVIQFAYVPLDIRQAVPQDTFAIQVNGLIVYLDCSVPLPENAENRWAALEARIDALQASLTDQIEGLAARITALESEPEQENWVVEIRALRENLDNYSIWMITRIIALKAQIYEELDKRIENSPPTDTSEWDAKLDNLETKMREERRTDDAQVRQDYEERIADSNEDAEYNTMMWSIGSALAVLGAVSGYFAIKKKFGDVSEKILKKTPKRHSSDDGKEEENPIKSQRKW